MFERPAPEIRTQGWARRALKAKTATRMHPDVKAFLDQCYESPVRIRDKQALLVMKEKFRDRIDPAAGRPMMLRQSQIRSYFSRRAAEEKKAGKKVCRAPQESDDEGDAGGSEVLVDGNPYAGLAMSELTKLVRDRGHAVTHGATPEDVRDQLTALDAATG